MKLGAGCGEVWVSLHLDSATKPVRRIRDGRLRRPGNDPPGGADGAFGTLRAVRTGAAAASEKV
jgi:hypothetical protein